MPTLQRESSIDEVGDRDGRMRTVGAAVLASAVDWMVTLQSGEATDRERAAFDAWYRQDASHRAAWTRLAGSLGPLRAAADLRLPDGAISRRAVQRRISRRGLAKAGLAGVAAVASVAVANRFVPLDEVLADHTTWTGERKVIALDGGGSVTLGPRTAVNVRDREGSVHIELAAGDLLLDSGGRRKPIEMMMGGWSLAPAPGRVTLHRRDDRMWASAFDLAMEVSIAEGGVRRVESGQTLSLDDGAVTLSPVDVAVELARTKGLLVAKDVALADVVDMMRPYFAGFIRVSPGASGIRTGGVYNLTTPRRTVDALAEAFSLSVREVTPYWLNLDVA